MKNLILISMILAIFSFSACGQKNEVPTKVKTAFSQKFPNSKKVKWDKENETEWEAEFKMNGKEYSANFSSDGKWMATEYEIEISEIPQLIKQTLDNEFVGYNIEEAEISETTNGKVYEFAMEKGEIEIEVVISPDGKVLKKEVLKEDDKEDND